MRNKTRLRGYHWPFPASLPNGNPEVLFYFSFIYNGFISGTSVLTSVDTILYQSYAVNDLRKHLFFERGAANVYYFKGTYTGNDNVFSGLANDELYLIQAECDARLGDTGNALASLNALLKHRIQAGSFEPYSTLSADAVLAIILTERRKELVGRDTRWTDLRRLNQDPKYAVTLKRTINGQSYSLPPNDPRYVFPIPNDVISASGIQQNQR